MSSTQLAVANDPKDLDNKNARSQELEQLYRWTELAEYADRMQPERPDPKLVSAQKRQHDLDQLRERTFALFELSSD